MSELITSCSTLEGDQIYPGISKVQSEGRNSFLRFGESNLPLLHGPRGMLPYSVKDMLLDAIPVTSASGRITAFTGGNAWHVRTLAINVSRLSFSDGFKMPPTDPRLIWAGGEGVGIPRLQEGDRHGQDQQQLFVLREGQKLIVADSQERILILTLQNGNFRLYKGEEEEFLDHVIGRAMDAKTWLEVRWCLKIFKAMRKERFADVVIAKAMALKQGFVSDWNRI